MSSVHHQFTGNTNSFNNTFNFNTETRTERCQILQWLSPLEPQQRHQDVRTERLEGVGNWVLETNEFKKWSDTEDGRAEQVLFCYGNPGVGKTYLSSLVIDSLCDQAGGEDTAVAGFYCDFLAQQEQSSASMLGAILKQLVSGGEIPENIREAFQKANKEFGGRGLLPPDLVEVLKKTIASLQRVFICIDAVDESTPKHRRVLLESLREIIRVSPNTRIFLTGRPHIDDEIVRCFGQAARIPISPTQNDILSYLEMRLDGDTDPSAMDNELRADIMRVIPEKTSEIFLLISLNIDAILGEITLHQRRKKLDEMTKGEGLGEAYAATLSRVRAQQRSRSKLGMDVLMWLSHAERPLPVEELCHALGVEEESIDLNIRNIPAVETLLSCSLGLVTVEKPSSTVRLVHYTLQEYLSHNPNLFLKPHSMIAGVCLTYLNFRQVEGISPTLRSAPPTVPFIDYASCYWGAHARQETTEGVKKLALKLLNGYDKHISSKLLLLHRTRNLDQPFDWDDTPSGFTGLHGAAFLGCEKITVALLEMNKWDAQAIDFYGNTAITWAVRKGHEGIVRILLERSNANPSTADIQYGRTPLAWAAKDGHEGIVTMLLERNDVNPDTADTQYGQTPPLWALESGHAGVLRSLLERSNDNPDTAGTKYGGTPLSWAARNGHEGVVRILLGRNDVNPNTTDPRYGRTPLSWASENGHDGVVRVLLERNDVNPNSVDSEYCRTPLSWASENGHEGVMRILLERSDVNPNTVDTQYGQTPLSWAAQSGNDEVVRILLERNDVDPNSVDSEYCRAPLSWAAGNGHEGVMQILLERSDVNPNTVDTRYGQTPLSWAAQSGNDEIVRILLERNDVNPNLADTEYNGTPLLCAAKNGHGEVVSILLERGDVNPNTADTQYGRTPLSWAAGNGHAGVVGILVERDDVNPNTTDTKYGRTPLSWAAGNGHELVVRMLLIRDDINPNRADTKYGGTPLFWAAGNGHEEVTRILLERGDVNPNTADTRYGGTPLSWAAENGHERVVRILLERSDVNPNTADTQYGATPLLCAAENGHEGVVRILLEQNDVNPNLADTEYGQTPLLYAAQNGHEGVVRILLERSDINPDTADSQYGQTPLSWAARSGSDEIVRILLERNDVNPDTADTKYGRMPLMWAVRNRHEGVVSTLLKRDDVNPSTTDTSGRTPLQFAVQKGFWEVVRLLQGRVGSVPRYASSQFAQLPPEPYVSFEPPCKRARRF